MQKGLRLVGWPIVCIISVFISNISALAQQTDRVPSTCLAVADNLHSPQLPVYFASYSASNSIPAAKSKYDVTISYQGHSTYLLESPEGVKIATDFAGWLVDRVVPDVVTMNQAHSSHFTNNPDPAIGVVLKGWGEGGKAAEHHVMIGDVLIRNVTTDILRFTTVPNGNSIFIFEMGGLCIGHLGHLHHKLTENHYANIGRLDVVMIAVDGGLTISHVGARDVLSRLRSSIVLPMHVRSLDAMPLFLRHLGDEFSVERLTNTKLNVSLRNLPKRPTVVILPGVENYYSPEE